MNENEKRVTEINGTFILRKRDKGNEKENGNADERKERKSDKDAKEVT